MIVLMSEMTDELQQMILQLYRKSQKVGLKVNMKKTKLMFIDYIPDQIHVDDEVIECVQEKISSGQKIGPCLDQEN